MNAPPEVGADLVPAAAAARDVPAAGVPKPEAPEPFLIPVLVASGVSWTAMVVQVVAGIALEALVSDPVFPAGMPKPAYGSHAAWPAQMVAVAAGVFGIACGLAAQGRRQVAGFAIAFAACALATAFVTVEWRAGNAWNGYNPTDWPCFVAPFLLSVALTALSAACLAFFVVTRTLRFVVVLFRGEAPSSSSMKTDGK